LRRTGGVVHLTLRTILEDARLRAACNDRRSTSWLVAGNFAADSKASNIPTLQHILGEFTAVS
jgi:hypothetical protein